MQSYISPVFILCNIRMNVGEFLLLQMCLSINKVVFEVGLKTRYREVTNMTDFVMSLCTFISYLFVSEGNVLV